jgi:hypothetical protein
VGRIENYIDPGSLTGVQTTLSRDRRECGMRLWWGRRGVGRDGEMVLGNAAFRENSHVVCAAAAGVGVRR